MAAYLTSARLRILRGAAYGRHGGPDLGVVSRQFIYGFEAVAERRNIAWLVERGLLQPNPHGDWYITEAGKEAAEVDAQGRPIIAGGEQ